MDTKAILERFCTKPAHANQVKTYAGMLFDAIYPNKKESREKTLLETAALLHDIGYFVERQSHHKHSLDLILENLNEDFSKEEIQVIAHTARYHRSSLPDETKHKKFSKLNEEQKVLIFKLAPLLKIADGLDNPHKNLITGIEYEEDDKSATIIVRTVGFNPKLATAEAKRDFFECVKKKPVNFIIKRI